MNRWLLVVGAFASACVVPAFTGITDDMVAGAPRFAYAATKGLFLVSLVLLVLWGVYRITSKKQP